MIARRFDFGDPCGVFLVVYHVLDEMRCVREKEQHGKSLPAARSVVGRLRDDGGVKTDSMAEAIDEIDFEQRTIGTVDER